MVANLAPDCRETLVGTVLSFDSVLGFADAMLFAAQLPTGDQGRVDRKVPVAERAT